MNILFHLIGREPCKVVREGSERRTWRCHTPHYTSWVFNTFPKFSKERNLANRIIIVQPWALIRITLLKKKIRKLRGGQWISWIWTTQEPSEGKYRTYSPNFFSKSDELPPREISPGLVDAVAWRLGCWRDKRRAGARAGAGGGWEGQVRGLGPNWEATRKKIQIKHAGTHHHNLRLPTTGDNFL